MTATTFPARDHFGLPTAGRGYRFADIERDRGDHEFPARYWVVCWSDTYNNHRSNPRYFPFATEDAALAFATTVPAYES